MPGLGAVGCSFVSGRHVQMRNVNFRWLISYYQVPFVWHFWFWFFVFSFLWFLLADHPNSTLFLFATDYTFGTLVAYCANWSWWAWHGSKRKLSVFLWDFHKGCLLLWMPFGGENIFNYPFNYLFWFEDKLSLLLIFTSVFFRVSAVLSHGYGH